MSRISWLVAVVTLACCSKHTEVLKFDRDHVVIPVKDGLVLRMRIPPVVLLCKSSATHGEGCTAVSNEELRDLRTDVPSACDCSLPKCAEFCGSPPDFEEPAVGVDHDDVVVPAGGGLYLRMHEPPFDGGIKGHCICGPEGTCSGMCGGGSNHHWGSDGSDGSAGSDGSSGSNGPPGGGGR
jgi:hypothetical protein